ncbi:hypothetical protein HZC31_02905 [Candidatus Woesearchaeota archaeon]|nr:hypothetical protein [Candidatus Woesearchaeota archaeon]
MTTEVVLKKWGNSIAAIFPKEVVEKERLKVNQKISIHIIKKADLRNIFGTLKTKMTGQEFKDMAREGWL